jgi:ClpP class serine protease
VAVALRQPLRSALVGSGPDHGRELGLDQGLVDGLGGLTDAVIHLRDLECVQDFDECRLVKGHRALRPFARTIAVVWLTIARTVAPSR